jgi:tetratricopeptide (TPR) repeat protein
MDYLVYAYLQQGRDREAEAVARDLASPSGPQSVPPVVRYNEMAIPARLVLERGRWAEAAALPLPGADLEPEFAAIPRFARALGAARAGRPAEAAAELAVLTALEAQLRERGDTHWPVVIGAQRRAVEAWIARARGRTGDAVRLAREAAELDESVEKHPVTPGPLLPARELQGDLLLELGRTREAQTAYEANLVREPRRARSLFGAARAAERASDRAAARRHYSALAELMSGADAGRAEADAARAFLGGR